MGFDPALIDGFGIKLMVSEEKRDFGTHLTEFSHVSTQLSIIGFKQNPAFEIVHKIKLNGDSSCQFINYLFHFVLKNQIHLDLMLTIWQLDKGYQRD